jgi:hypothetical protein
MKSLTWQERLELFILKWWLNTLSLCQTCSRQTVANLDRIPLYTKDTFLQLIKELRPAIKPLEGMGKGKTTDEWFDILVKDIEEKL